MIERVELRRDFVVAALLFALCTAGCSGARQSERIAAAPTEPPLLTVQTRVAGVGRVPYETFLAALGERLIEPIEEQHQATIGSWKVAMKQFGAMTLRAEGGRLVVRVPIVVNGELVARGKRSVQMTMLAIEARTAVHLRNGQVHLEVVSIDTAGEAWSPGKVTSFLGKAAQKLLRERALPVVREKIDAVRVGLSASILPEPLWLSRPFVLRGGDLGCLLVRPGAVTVTSIALDPSFVRVGVSVASRPSLLQTCATKATSTPNTVTMQFDKDFAHTRATLAVRATMPRNGASKLDEDAAVALIERRLAELGNGVMGAGQAWRAKMSKPRIKITAKRVRAQLFVVDASVTGWLVIGDTRRR